MAECVVFGVVAVCEGVGVGVVAGSVWGCRWLTFGKFMCIWYKYEQGTPGMLPGE